MALAMANVYLNLLIAAPSVAPSPSPCGYDQIGDLRKLANWLICLTGKALTDYYFVGVASTPSSLRTGSSCSIPAFRSLSEGSETVTARPSTHLRRTALCVVWSLLSGFPDCDCCIEHLSFSDLIRLPPRIPANRRRWTL